MAKNTKNTKTTKKKPASAVRSSSRQSSARSSAQKKRTQPLIRREIWAGITLLLALIAFLAFFSVRGFVIDWYKYAVGSLIGYGLVMMPFALLWAGALLIIKRKGRARLRVSCIMLMPLLFAAIRHVLAPPVSLGSGMDAVRELAAAGRDIASGGLLSGALASLLTAAISKTGAVILLAVLLVAAFFIACNSSIASLFGWLRAHKPLPEPDEPEKPAVTVVPAAPARKRRGSPAIDIQLNDDDAIHIAPQTGRGKKDDPLPPPSVKTPAEAIKSIFSEKSKKTAADKPAAANDPTAPVQPSFETAQAELPRPGAPAEPDAAAADETPVEQQIENALSSQDAPVYLYPPASLLKPGSGMPEGLEESTRICAERLIDTLSSFGIEASIVDVTCGPAVTRYELQLRRGIKVSRIVNLSDDIALALGAAGVRVSTIPDKNAVGIEVPNEKQELVTAGDIINTQAFRGSRSRLSFAVGKDIAGNCVIGDIAKMPHVLIAGTTGSGKSVCINSILISLLYKSTPDEVRLIMVDPKMIELGVYNGIPHLLIPVVTDPRKAAGALGWAVSEMMHRYQLFSELGVRDLTSYNTEIVKREDGKALPQIVVVIDELSDLMATARSEVEEAIIRLAQMARAAGMHLIVATQRPSADVITGLMKTNIPSRIAFAVSSQIDSRIILDQMGAEKLLGKGDMLYSPLGSGKPQRIQGCFVSDSEVEAVVSFVKQSGQPDYSDEIMDHINKHAENPGGAAGAAADGAAAGDEDELLQKAIEIVVEGGQASTSMLQRRLKLGYARAARLIDEMEERGIVSRFEGSKPRDVLITREQWQEMVLRKSE
ncbi:MAG: DNA translocase FtsK [Clostridia bacterium]|nr:DNA translocase FtsK [Clostridia bacterium]